MTGNEDLVNDIDNTGANENLEIGLNEDFELFEDLKPPKVLLDKTNHVDTDVRLIDLEEDNRDLNLCVDEAIVKPTEDHDLSKKSECDNENKENSKLTVVARTKPIVHSPSEKPLCQKHIKSRNQILKIDCDDCFSLLSDPNTSISQIFGAMREWMPGSQKKMNILVDEILKRGAHIDDMDGLEGNTMLHYACKSASEGIGSSDMAKQLVRDLIDKGANSKLRSRWTDMLPLHFAAYFNCPEILEVLLDVSGNADIDARCKEYDQGTALHMAASGLCYNAAKFLIERGADPTLINNMIKTPYECVAEGTKQNLRQTPTSVQQLRDLLTNAKSPVSDHVLKDMGVSLGEDVVVGGDKSGTLMFCGRTDFASGVWCGVELHEKTGKNNGSVAAVTYFKCKPGHGMFAPPSKLSALEKERRPSQSSNSSETPRLKVGDRVSVIGYKLGYIRFLGKVRFSGGLWVGVELDKPYGKCNGTSDGVKYFTCKPQHGVLVPVDKVRRSEAAGRSEKETVMSPKMSRASSGKVIVSPGAGGGIFDTNRSPVCASPMRAAPMGVSTPCPPAVHSPAVRSPAVHAGLTSPTTSRVVRSPGVVRSNSGGLRGNSGGSRGTSPSRSNTSSENIYKKQIKLQPGMNAFVNGELGTVKYVGRVDFSEGIWVGVHLKNQNGKNDGTVQGRRYFSCKPGYGIMVRPSKVTIHGISASRLIDERDYPE